MHYQMPLEKTTKKREIHYLISLLAVTYFSGCKFLL